MKGIFNIYGLSKMFVILVEWIGWSLVAAIMITLILLWIYAMLHNAILLWISAFALIGAFITALRHTK